MNVICHWLAGNDAKLVPIVLALKRMIDLMCEYTCSNASDEAGLEEPHEESVQPQVTYTRAGKKRHSQVAPGSSRPSTGSKLEWWTATEKKWPASTASLL